MRVLPVALRELVEGLMPMTDKKLIRISLRKILVSFIFSNVISRFFRSVRSRFFLFFSSSNRNSKKSWKSDANESQEIDSDLVEENIGKFYFHVIFSDVISRFFLKKVSFACLVHFRFFHQNKFDWPLIGLRFLRYYEMIYFANLPILNLSPIYMFGTETG